MKSLGSLSIIVAIVLIAAPTLLFGADRPPRLESLDGDAFTEAERRLVIDWTLAQKEVVALLSDHRVRVLRAGSDQPKGSDGAYRRATLFVRDYDLGVTRWISVDLSDGALDIRTIAGTVQPSPEEIIEAKQIILADPELARQARDPGLSLLGGFHNRSPFKKDPCSRDVCLEMAFMPVGGGGGPTRVMMVNLSSGKIAHRDYPGTLDPTRPQAMTETRQGEQP